MHFPKEFTDEQKRRLAAALTAVVTEHFGTDDGAVSIALRPVDRQEWNDRVVDHEITGREHRLIKEPRYRSV
nr:tautomerase family protein [Streptomyces taklimakanensis]